jgi:hypothetical protein
MGESGARGRDRTADTAIFSRMLYQLSYPGIGPRRTAWGWAFKAHRQTGDLERRL